MSIDSVNIVNIIDEKEQGGFEITTQTIKFEGGLSKDELKIMAKIIEGMNGMNNSQVATNFAQDQLDKEKEKNNQNDDILE